MASQTEVLKALHEKEGPTKTLDLAKEVKTVYINSMASTAALLLATYTRQDN